MTSKELAEKLNLERRLLDRLRTAGSCGTAVPCLRVGIIGEPTAENWIDHTLEDRFRLTINREKTSIVRLKAP